MPRNNNPIVNLNTWKHRDMQNIADEPKGRRRHVIADRLGWTKDQMNRVDYHRARVVMQYLHSQWSGVEYLDLVDNGNHKGVYERIYNWCVHELQPVPPWRCLHSQCMDALVRIQALARRYEHRHSWNGHLKYSCGGFIFGAYEKRRTPKSF